MTTRTKTKPFDALKWVSLAAAREDNRPVLTLAHWKSDQATLACADGFRLFVARGLTPPEGIIQGKYDQYVPIRKVRGGVESNQGELDGRFPDYEAIIPRSFACIVTLNPARLTEAVKRAMVFARDNNDSVRLDVYPELHVIRVSGRSPVMGDCETIIDCGIEWSEAFSMAFNGHYLLDALTGFTERVELQFAGAKNPLVIGDLSDHFALLMPMAFDRSGNTSSTVPPTPDVPDDPIERERCFALPVNPVKPKHKKLLPYGYAGGNIRHMLAGSPLEALKQDLYNALTLSASAYGDPKVQWDSERKVLEITLRNSALYWAQRRFSLIQETRFQVGNPQNSNAYRATCEYPEIEITGDLIISVALAWHWDRLLTRALIAPESPAQRFVPRYHPNTGSMSAFRKRARLLVVGESKPTPLEYGLNLDSLQQMIQRVNSQFGQAKHLKRLYEYSPYKEYESGASMVKVYESLLHRLYREWDRRDPLPEKWVDFVVGGSHRLIQAQEEMLYRHGIYFRDVGALTWGKSYLTRRYQVNAHHIEQMKTLGFHQPRKKPFA